MALITGFSSSVWQRFSRDVTGSTTDNIDLVNKATFRGCHYIVMVYNDTEEKTKNFHVAVNRSGNTIKESVYARVGDSLDYEISFSIVSDQLNFSFKNNETFTLTIEVARLLLN